MDVRQFAVSAVAAIAFAISLAGTAWACGDKLVALGGGIGFERVMVSRHPGHIVLLLEPATGLTEANDKFHLASSLSLAGHEVFVASSVEELHAKRDSAAPDLILVDAVRAAQLQFRPVAGGDGPIIMPVLYTADRGQPEVAEEQAGCMTVAAGRKGSQLLKAVENALRLRSRGLPQPCQKSTNSQQA